MKTLYINGSFYGVFNSIEVQEDRLVADDVEILLSAFENYNIVEGAEYPIVVPTIEVPQSITDLQAWQVLAQIGKLEEVKAMAIADVLFGIWFDRALIWERNNEYVVSAGASLGLTESEIDELFILGATL